MSTRGFITFVVDGEEKTAYNHCDSYPDGLGVRLLEWLKAALDSVDALRDRARALRVVDEGTPPTAEDIRRLGEYSWGASQHGGAQDLREGQQWYDLLRETQGDPDAMLTAGVIEDARDFPQDSLFAEWGYVIDLDAEVLEVYEGFQKSRPRAGRFAGRESTTAGYYPVALVASYPFAELPDGDAIRALESED